MTKRWGPLVTGVAAVCGVLTACSSGASAPASPAPRPAATSEISPCAFFTGDELKDYELHDPMPMASPPGCLWQGSKFFKQASTALTLTLLDRSADEEVKTLTSSSGELISERPPVNGRRVWRDTTPGTDVKCGLLFAVDTTSAATVKLSEYLGISGVRPTQQNLCDGLDELAPRIEAKLPAVTT
ncbi:DUF3558 family protein [Amycolatopsis sp. GM8]|uniref:DUF3558 family protein n=1 Tax=Amycolatopsis sp. GM8 TaxID=2896530 RepID=UPI001F1A89FF|nr:DUF3558 family protein [Amycolatopsis sp. GM8]